MAGKTTSRMGKLRKLAEVNNSTESGGKSTTKGKAPQKRVGRWDEVKLWQLGYKQELKRELTCFNNTAIGFSVLSFYALCNTYATQGLLYGGPVSVIWGWVICSVFSLAVAACLSELLSAYPTSGGLYYWSFTLSPPRWRGLVCWVTGWLNLLGQVAFTAGLEYALAETIAAVVYLHTGGMEGGGVKLTPSQLSAVCVGLLAIHTLMNTISIRVTAYWSTVSALWHVIATAAFCLTVLLTAPRLRPAEFVLGEFTPNSDRHGVTSGGYVFLIGLLMSQWTIMGYDASIHMVEETVNAEYWGPYALMASVLGCCGGGLLLILALTFSLQDVGSVLATDNQTGGTSALLQVVWDVFYNRYGSGAGVLGLMYVPLGGLFLCACSSLCANSRMLYAFSRDGAIPGARIWKKLHATRALPMAATYLMAGLSLALVIPCFYNKIFFTAVSAASVVALSLSYGIPIYLRLWADKYQFIPGPVNFGRAGRPLAAISVAWIALVSVVFVLPTQYPVTADNVNYAAPLIVAVLMFSLSWYYAPVIGGRYWFTGPAPNLE